MRGTASFSAPATAALVGDSSPLRPVLSRCSELAVTRGARQAATTVGARPLRLALAMIAPSSAGSCTQRPGAHQRSRSELAALVLATVWVG